ncbi:MAG: saccharopine dehydrogenase C-terminal domain-containing protein, partial [Anaerolineae bacterium]|jgi:saccharopine dehydrogenase-like NADP-dependent oxidoreductase
MLDNLVSQADLAVSLLPYVYHVQVAKACIGHPIPMVTTSYVSDDMQALDQDAREAGVILLNEVGLDPGIDHMSAMRIIDRVHDESGEIKAFRSFCGGLPAPEANDNPLGYKFSWSPRGVLLAGRNDARYLRNGKIVEVPNERLFASHYVTRVEGLGDLESYPNRNALPYIDRYGIPETETMYRGTLRNLGWCNVMQKLNDLGYFSLDEQVRLHDKTFRQVMADLIEKDPADDLKVDLARQLNVAPNSGVMMTLEWLGLLNDESMPETTTLLDALAARMLDKMQYRDRERDMVVLVHEFLVAYRDREESITSTLIDFGVPDGDTAMARTVGSPAAIGARMILEGEISLTGVHIPVVPEIYQPILDELESLGVVFEESLD